MNLERARALLEELEFAIERRKQRLASDGKGMQVPDHSMFCNTNHAAIVALDRWAKEMREALTEAQFPSERRTDWLKEARKQMLDDRCVEDPCDACAGTGVKLYSSTATWRGGCGGQALTHDVCDKCWGSGDKHKRWTDLRQLFNRMKGLETQAARPEK